MSVIFQICNTVQVALSADQTTVCERSYPSNIYMIDNNDTADTHKIKDKERLPEIPGKPVLASLVLSFGCFHHYNNIILHIHQL